MRGNQDFHGSTVPSKRLLRLTMKASRVVSNYRMRQRSHVELTLFDITLSDIMVPSNHYLGGHRSTSVKVPCVCGNQLFHWQRMKTSPLIGCQDCGYSLGWAVPEHPRQTRQRYIRWVRGAELPGGVLHSSTPTLEVAPSHPPLAPPRLPRSASPLSWIARIAAEVTAAESRAEQCPPQHIAGAPPRRPHHFPGKYTQQDVILLQAESHPAAPTLPIRNSTPPERQPASG